MTTIDQLVRARQDDPSPALYFEDQCFSHEAMVQASSDRAGYLMDNLDPARPPHVGVLLDNVPEFPMWLGAAALSGSVVVGINPTRRGAELARDVAHTQCQMIVTSARHLHLVEALGPAQAGLATVLVADSGDPAGSADQFPRCELAEPCTTESSLFLLLFTSGTTGAPKACICSQGRLAAIAQTVAAMFSLGSSDVCYQAMPMFHSNALMAGWAPCLAAGAAGALRRRFSASAFLPDVRRYGATYFNYVGRPLSYILATPEARDDADNPLVRVFGNEGGELDIDRFARRFGCEVVDSYGSTEGGVSVARSPGMPSGALGRASAATAVLDSDTAKECPPAIFSPDGVLLNADLAVGELVDRSGAVGFEGYWDNQEASRARVRDGIYWSGDLAYRDAQGWLYFAGRDYDWLRVDGENFAAAPVERILSRFPGVVLAAVYAVPDPEIGDQVMAGLQLEPGARFDPRAFKAFLDQQSDLGTKWAPRLVRLCPEIPLTQTNKILKRQLRSESWRTADPMWWRPDKDGPYVGFGPPQATALGNVMAANGRGHLIGL
ncbi:MAG: AMP-binding protein [Acidimicrobiales bacterium]